MSIRLHTLNRVRKFGEICQGSKACKEVGGQGVISSFLDEEDTPFNRRQTHSSKSVLGTMQISKCPIFKVTSSILKSLESIRSRFFNGQDPKSNKASWVKWNKVLTPKDKGGLGVSSLFALNRGLMLKWVWRFYSQKCSLWTKVIKAIYGEDGNLNKDVSGGVRTCWTSIVHEVRVLQGRGINVADYIRLKLGNGENTRFWVDNWYEGGASKS
ncbi:hypothetical protein Tco_0714413 [Tanacetum coccineum]